VRQARRREFHQIISLRNASRDRYVESLPVTGVPVSAPGNEACVSP
jgi:hypothetical protein